MNPSCTAATATTDWARVPQRVLQDDADPAQPLRPRRSDVIGRERIDHAAAHQPQQGRNGHERQDDGGQDVSGPFVDAVDRQPAEIDAEPDHEQQAEPERRHGLTNQRHHPDRHVDPRALPQGPL